MMALKYSAPQIGTMTEQQLSLWTKSLLLKIHVITGWVIPDAELLNILIDQFGKKLIENYGNLNVEEIEYAFRKAGTTIKDWGKAMNLALIDEVLIPYLNQRFELSAAEEKKKENLPEQVLYTDKQLEDQQRGDIEAFYQRLRKGQIPYAIPHYFKPILVKDGIMKQGDDMAEFFMGKLGNSVENIYVREQP